MKAVCRDLTTVGLLVSLFTFLSAPFLVRAFGISDGTLLSQGIVALRIVSVTLVFQTLLVLFFALYYMIELELLAFTIGVFKSLISPIVLTIMFSLISKSRTGLFVGLAVAPVVSMIVCAQAVFKRYGREKFPYMVPQDMDDRTFIYDFEVNPKNAVEMSRTVNAQLQAFSVIERIRMLASVFIEDMLMLILEKNPDRKKLEAECTIIIEPDGVRLILRDSGVIFDITDEDALADSFRRYVAANLMANLKTKAYITTIGYNRNELFFPESVTGAAS